MLYAKCVICDAMVPRNVEEAESHCRDARLGAVSLLSCDKCEVRWIGALNDLIRSLRAQHAAGLQQKASE